MAMFFYEVTYNIMLQGKFKLLELQQTFDRHHYIAGGWLKERFGPNSIFENRIETETGFAEVNIFTIDNNQPDYSDKILFKIPIATPPRFIDIVVALLDELTGLFTFSTAVYEIRMREGYTLGWYDVDDYARLSHDYREIHKMWRAVTGMPACKTTELLLPRDCIYVQVKQKQRPVDIILCPQGSDLNFYQLGGFPHIEVRGAVIDKDEFYRRVETIQLDQCRLLGIHEKIKAITSSSNRLVPETDVAIEVILIEIDMIDLELTIHFNDKEQVRWIDCELEFGTPDQVVKRALQCIIELATELDWDIIEGLDFKKYTPVGLDTQKLIEFISVPPEPINNQEVR
jgi:hypothetical protein